MAIVPLKMFRFCRTEDKCALASNYDDTDWETVYIPHDWAITGEFSEEHDIQVTTIEADGETQVRRHTGRTGGLPHSGTAVYRASLPLPDKLSDQRVYIDFDGVMSHSEVHVNGRLIGARPYGYIPFAFDITDALHQGEDNILAVRVDNPDSASRWYPGAGIYRNARLHIVPGVHFSLYGTRVESQVNDDGTAEIAVSARVRNLGSNDSQTTVAFTIANASGETLLSAQQVRQFAAGKEESVDNRFLLQNVRRWDVDDPHCYTLTTSLCGEDGGEYQATTRFGIRTTTFSARDGFLLNGRPRRFNGVCLHHDLGPLGAAVNRRALEHRLELLRDMGCNAIRTSHNPVSPELLELCDNMGVLVIEEAFDEWTIAKVKNGYASLFDRWAEDDLREMIRRHANHPCIVMWSIGNEIPEQRLADGYKTARFLANICRDEDPGRPVTAGLNITEQALYNGFARELDVLGFNYTPDKYGRYRHDLPDLPMYGSETASTVSSRGVYHFPVHERIAPASPDLQTSSYDLDTTGWSTTPDLEFRGQEENPSIMGEFVWTGTDYLGEPTPYGLSWPSRSSYFGIIDLCGIPKDRYYLYQGQWSDKAVLHIVPHWTWPGREGAITPVQCYTNFSAVEMFLNGRSLGLRQKSARQLLARYRLLWPDVVYEPGTLRAVGYDTDGKVAMEREIHTTGDAAALRLDPDRTLIESGGEDLSFVTVRIVDRQGTLCPHANNLIRFTVDGPAEIAGVGNGDATSVEPFLAPYRKAFGGMCMLILRSSRDGQSGEVRVSAAADGLAPYALTIEVRTG